MPKFCCTISKKIEGERIGVFEKFSKKKQKMRIFKQSHTADKSERDPLGFFNIRSVAKYQNKLKGGPFEHKKISQKKSHKAEKREESQCLKSENLLLRNTCKKISAYSRVRTLWVEKQASYTEAKPCFANTCELLKKQNKQYHTKNQG